MIENVLSGLKTSYIRNHALLKTLKAVLFIFPLFSFLYFFINWELISQPVLIVVLTTCFIVSVFFVLCYQVNIIQKDVDLKSYHALFYNELIFSFTIGTDGIIQDINDKIENYFEIDRDQIIGKDVSIFFSKTSLEVNKEALSACAQGEIKRYESTVVHPDGRFFDAEFMVVPVKVRNKVIRIIGMFQDISERKQLQGELNALVNLDGLTGIANRRAFDKTIDIEWERAQVQQMPLSIMLVDIDDFKKYNDIYGHLKGDTCLKTIANILQDSIYIDNSLVARYGGEEFVIILPETKRSDAVQLANKLRSNIEDYAFPHRGSSTGDHVTISIGVAGIVPSSIDRPEELLKLADDALYQSKANGGNYVCIGRKKSIYH